MGEVPGAGRAKGGTQNLRGEPLTQEGKSRSRDPSLKAGISRLLEINLTLSKSLRK